MDAAQASRRGRLVRRMALDTRPLSVPAYRRTLIGQGGSYVGTMITEVAVPVQIYADSRSSLYVGLAGLAGLVPIVVFGLYGGAIADAVDRRRLALWSSLVTWAVTVLLLAQALLGLRSIALILALVVVQSAGFAVSSSTRAAIIPSIVPVKLVPAANTLSYTVSNIGQILGPLVAGVLVGLPDGFACACAPDELRGRLQGVFTVVVAGGPRLGDLRAGAMAATTGFTIAWSGAAAVCIGVVLVSALAVRSFWCYDASEPGQRPVIDSLV
jgi:MFS family permease